MKKATLLFALLIHAWTNSDAQNILSLPPNSAAAAKMMDNSVNLNTGVPQISIPLYVLGGRKLSYPIALSYNAAGIKVSEVAGPVGLGWSLNEPIITRVPRGRPDEWPSSYFQYASAIPNYSATNPIPASTLMCLADGDCDMQPDVFYFNTGFDGGKFMFDNQLIPQTIPKKQLKISFDDTSTLANAQITTYDGTKYLFIGGETAIVPAVFGSSSYKTTWYLSKIISVDNADTIKFNYSTSATYTEGLMKGGFLYFFYGQPPGSEAHRAQYEVDELFGSEDVQISGTKYLESIESSKGKVVFQFGSRLDDPNLKKINNIIVYYKDPISSQFVEDKRFNFSYSYFEAFNGNDDSRLKLDAIEEFKSPGSTMPPYQFIYSTKKLPSTQSSAQDPWGYFNGAVTNNSLVPATTFQGQVISTSDRQIHSEYVDGCILQKIISPLGGITEYVFEPNRYGSTNAYGPGLRVAKIINTDPYSNINAVTNYEYLDPSTGTSSGVLLEDPSFTATHIPVEDVIVHQEPGGSQDTVLYNCMLIPIHATGVGAFGSTPLVYEYVTVFHGDDVNVSGKTTYKFSVTSAISSVYPHFTKPDNNWKLGNPKEVKHFKVELGTPTIVGFTQNSFSEHPTFTTIKGVNAAWMKLYIIQTPQVSSVVSDNFIQESKFTFLESVDNYSYEQNSGTLSSVVIQKSYYDRTDGYFLPNRITTTTSESTTTLEKEFFYPIDFPATGIFGEMQNRNMISYPVETRSVLRIGSNEYVTDYQKTDYSNLWPNSGIYPKFSYRGKFADKVLKSSFLSNPSGYLQTSALINRYAVIGFPVEAMQEGGVPSSVIIDQRHATPVAQITNADYDSVAYSSFESWDHGNWKVDAGSAQETRNATLTQNGAVAPIFIAASQSVSYTYTVSQSAGPRPILTFSKIGATPIEYTLTLSSSNGSVSLSAGNWNASLSFDTNVTSVSVSISYTYTNLYAPNIVSTDSKTGLHSLLLTSTHTITKTDIPVGDYVVSYYEKNGSVAVGLTSGASLLSTEVGPLGNDGWTHVKKIIRVASKPNAIQLTGSNVKIDELRLFAQGSIMSTVCYDAQGRIQTETDANLRSRFYEYDEWGRIIVIRDHDKNILEHREYKFGTN